MRYKTDIDQQFKKVNIKKAEIRYIFTINLNGKFNDLSSGFSEELKKLFDAESNIELKSTNPDEIFPVKMSDSFVRYYVDKKYIEYASPIRWLFNIRLQNRILDDAINYFKDNVKCSTDDTPCRNGLRKEVCNEYYDFHERISESNMFLEFLNVNEATDAHAISGIEVKIFTQGAISILLRFGYRKNANVYDTICDIRYPENISIESDDCYLGPLNKLAIIIAELAFKRLLDNKKYVQFSKHISKCFNSYSKNTTYDESIKYARNNFNKVSELYVGFICSGYEYSLAEIDRITTAETKLQMENKITIALANNTPEFLHHFSFAEKYINDTNIARGEEVILIERRGWIVNAPRIRKTEERDRYRTGIIASLLYSIESIFSTTMTIESFNENLEILARNISFKFNNNIFEFYDPDTRNTLLNQQKNKKQLTDILKNFISDIAKCRTMSPCEDITTSMEAHVKSQTAVKAIKKLKTYGLTDLVELARLRMRNYGYFMQTGHDILMAEGRKTQNSLMTLFTLIILILTFLTALNFFGNDSDNSVIDNASITIESGQKEKATK